MAEDYGVAVNSFLSMANYFGNHDGVQGGCHPGVGLGGSDGGGHGVHQVDVGVDSHGVGRHHGRLEGW